MNNALSDIVICDIDISSPPSDNATFDTILLVVRAPEVAGKETLKTVTAIKSASELLDYGYTVESVAYKAAIVAFSQDPSPNKLYITARTLTSGVGVTPEVFEDINLTLNKAIEEEDFYGIHLTEFRSEEDVTKAADWAEANQKLFAYEFTEFEGNPIKTATHFRTFGIFCLIEGFFAYEFTEFEGNPIKTATHFRTFGMYSGNAVGFETDNQPENNKYAALALMAKCFGYEPGSETWNMKELSLITESALSTSRKDTLDSANVTSFRRYAGKNVTYGGKALAGEWIDVIRFRDWLKATMQFNVFAALQANKKVPYTDSGIGLIENAMEQTLLAGQRVGGVAETEYDDNGTPIPGFTVVVPKSASITEAERKSRKLSGCSFKARLAGAIHVVEINGNLTN